MGEELQDRSLDKAGLLLNSALSPQHMVGPPAVTAAHKHLREQLGFGAPQPLV